MPIAPGYHQLPQVVFRSQNQQKWPPLAFYATDGSTVYIGAGAGPPTNGASGTFAGVAPAGSLYIDVTNGTLYTNINTAASPNWSAGAGKSVIVAKTADYTVTGSDSNTLFTTTGAAGAVNFTLPAVASSAGRRYRFFNMVDQNMVITAPAGTLVGPGNAGRTTCTFSTASQKIGASVEVICDGAKWLPVAIPSGITATFA